MASDESNSTSCGYNSGLQSPTRHGKQPQKEASDEIITAMFEGIGSFSARVITLTMRPYISLDEIRGLSRLDKTANKLLFYLHRERMDLENELRPKSPDTEKALQPNDNNVMVWSEYFNNTPSPTKKKRMKTSASPTTKAIGVLSHSVMPFVTLSLEATCSSKRKPENKAYLKHIMALAEKAIEQLETIRDDIKKYYQKRDAQNANAATSNQIPTPDDTFEPNSADLRC